MKIGFSLGRCIRDIVNDKVSLEDVAFIIAATNIHSEEQLVQIVDQYLYRDEYLYMLDEAKCQSVAKQLWNNNQILQPRRQGMMRHKQPEIAIWADMYPTVTSNNEAVKTSWDAYRFMIHMVENVDNEAMDFLK